MHDIGSGRVDEDVLQHDVDVALFVVNTHVFVCTSKVADAQQLVEKRTSNDGISLWEQR